MRTVTATTTRTSATGISLKNNVTLIDPRHTWLISATMWAAYTKTVIVITKPLNAAVHTILTTETVHASGLVRGPKRLVPAQISVVTMISTPSNVFIISALVRTTIETVNAISIGTQVSQEQPAVLSTDITLMKAIGLDSIVMPVTSTRTIAAIGQTIAATHIFRRHITRVHALPLEAIIHKYIHKDATIIPSHAHMLWADSVTTCITVAGRKGNVMRQTVTTTAPMEDVTCPTITVLPSITPTRDVTSTHPSSMTAVHADCLMVSYTLAPATTTKTARSRCSSPVMANATKIRQQ